MDNFPANIVWVTIEGRVFAGTFEVIDNIVTTYFGKAVKTAQTAGIEPRKVATILLSEMVKGIGGHFA